MTVAAVHIADVGLPRSLGLLRAPRPSAVHGLRKANAGLAATFGTAPARPALGRAGVISFWDDAESVAAFEASPAGAKLGTGLVIHATPLRIHGAWQGVDPELTKRRTVEHEGPVLVLTLARTRFSRSIPFFRASQPAEKAVVRAPGNLFSTAVVRPPFIASVSIWASSEAAMDYAYSGQQAGHPEAIAAGNRKPFHHEQAFIRLAIDELRGSLGGRNSFDASTVELPARQ